MGSAKPRQEHRHALGHCVHEYFVPDGPNADTLQREQLKTLWSLYNFGATAQLQH